MAAIAAAALGGGYYVMSNRMNGQRWNNLLPEMQNKVLQLLELAGRNGLQVMFWDGWRPPEESAKNIAAGTSKVSNPLNSLHVWGAAADIVFRDAAGMPTWLEDASKPAGWVDPRWVKLAELGKSIGLLSGGLSWGWDWPHFQLPQYMAGTLVAKYNGDYRGFLKSRGVVTT